ncbi:hypothetical protein [Pseudomonas phoenicis]|uniref:hypothetical protein n=1 Tax=unclassified Pseudomonas TaxID=196821 RepID=UPI00399FAB8C
MSKESHSLTIKIATIGAGYEHQADSENHKKGDITKSTAGHMWYSFNDGVSSSVSSGFQSKSGTPYGAGDVSIYDDQAYRETTKEITIGISASQYTKLIDFSKHPENYGFDTSRYNALTNSCIDYTYAALTVIGLNPENEQGDILPVFNDDNIKDLFYTHGANIIRDDLVRRGDYYEDKEGQKCIWLNASDVRKPPESSSPVELDIIPSPQPQQHIENETQAQDDVANGHVSRSATHRISAPGGLLNATDFASTQMAGLATGGVRPGEVQLDENVRPNAHLSSFYTTPEAQQPNFGLRNAMVLNGLSSMAAFNTYVDPLLLDLTGSGVHMIDLTDVNYIPIGRNHVAFTKIHTKTSLTKKYNPASSCGSLA